jgi:hypothetical protein
LESLLEKGVIKADRANVITCWISIKNKLSHGLSGFFTLPYSAPARQAAIFL